MRNRRGFTFLEMCLGMIITGMVGLAVSGFSLTVAKYWQQAGREQMLQVSGAQASGVTGSIIESARSLGSVLHGDDDDESIFLWQTDSFGGTADGVVQLAEMSLIEYRPEIESIVYYQADLSLNLTNNATAGLILVASDMSNPNVAAGFKRQTAWLKPRRTLLGPGRAQASDAEATRVINAAFTQVTGSARAAVTIDATLTRSSSEYAFRQRFGVRAASDVPTSTTATLLQTVAGTVTNLLGNP